MCDFGGGEQSTTSTFTPPKNVRKLGNEVLTRTQEQLDQPYVVPTQQIAGWTPDQMLAFQGVRDAQGVWSPYWDQAKGYAESAANPITEGDINNYFNPWADEALAAFNDDIGSRWKTQQGNLVQSAGGVGADRIAVGQAEGMRQNNLARGQLLSDIWSKALAAAQQGKGREANAAAQFAQLGQGAQGASYTDAGALYGAGTAQQGLGQQELNADYAAAIANLDAPWKNLERAGNTVARVGPAMGGTTTNTYPGASPIGQIAGLAGTAAGAIFGGPAGAAIGGQLAGGFGNMFGGGTPTGFTGNTTNPFAGVSGATTSFMGGVPYPMLAATGGRITPYAEGGAVTGEPDFVEMMLSPWKVPGKDMGGSMFGGPLSWNDMIGASGLEDYGAFSNGAIPPQPGPPVNVPLPDFGSKSQDRIAAWPTPEPPPLPPTRVPGSFPADPLQPDVPPKAIPAAGPAGTIDVPQPKAGVDPREVLSPEKQRAFIESAYRPYRAPPGAPDFTPRKPNPGTWGDRLLEFGLATLAASGERDSRGLPLSGLGAIGKGGMASIAGRRKETELDQKNIAQEQRAKEQADDATLARARIGETARGHDLLASDRLTRDQSRALKGSLIFNYTKDGVQGVMAYDPETRQWGFRPGERKESPTSPRERIVQGLVDSHGLTYQQALETAGRPGTSDRLILSKEAEATRRATAMTPKDITGLVDTAEYRKNLESERRKLGLAPLTPTSALE